MWRARVHLNAIDAKIHLPFLLRLIAFFVKPRMVEPISMMQQVDTDPVKIATQTHWRLEAIVRQVRCPRSASGLPCDRHPIAIRSPDVRYLHHALQIDVLLINHTHGPNMPLQKIKIRDGYFLGVHRRGTILQCDLQLPIEVSTADCC